ncbi:MAG TPA: STAS/SEC14 domain-containing protein [Chthoniobacterales bacterium]
MHRITQNEGNLITVRVSGRLTQEDYDQLIPAWEKEIAEHGSMRMLLLMEDFHGWTPGAGWDDFHFTATHAKHIERVAMVGEKKWQEWFAKVGSLLVSEDVRYFDLANLSEAERWVRTD